jgi:hypothetical protein
MRIGRYVCVARLELLKQYSTHAEAGQHTGLPSERRGRAVLSRVSHTYDAVQRQSQREHRNEQFPMMQYARQSRENSRGACGVDWLHGASVEEQPKSKQISYERSRVPEQVAKLSA